MDTKNAINASLKVLGVVGLAGITIVAPNTLQGFSVLLKKSPVKKSSYQRVLTELKRQDLVYVTKDGEEISYTLTPAGAYRLQQVMIDEISIKIPKKWDRKWRVVTFDIPIKNSKQRAAFVHRLKNLGFVMVQKSMWVHPAPCFSEVEQLAGHYNVMRYCILFEVNKFDDLSTRKLIRHFDQLTHT